MEKSCKYFEDMLVDYADGRLSPGDSSEVAEHLPTCDCCRELLDGLQKSLDLAGVIWTDGLAETEPIRVPILCRPRSLRWPRYAAIAASILLVATASVVWFSLTRPQAAELTVAEIEREIIESASAARLLAATEMLAECPGMQPIVHQQYRYIAETYPETTAANKVELKVQ